MRKLTVSSKPGEEPSEARHVSALSLAESKANSAECLIDEIKATMWTLILESVLSCSFVNL